MWGAAVWCELFESYTHPHPSTVNANDVDDDDGCGGGGGGGCCVVVTENHSHVVACLVTLDCPLDCSAEAERGVLERERECHLTGDQTDDS